MWSEPQESFSKVSPLPGPLILIPPCWGYVGPENSVIHSFSEIGPNPASQHPPLRWILVLQKLGLINADTELFHLISAPEWVIHPSY